MTEKILNPKVQALINAPATQAPQQRSAPDAASFREVLQSRLNLRLSGHAETRLNGRGIELSQQDWERVAAGMERAAGKGSKESLVMLDEVALIVSVRNRTVITAVAKDQLKENVFTNIDSAVFV